MKKEEFNFVSSDELHRIHAIRWIPEGTVKGVLQICHGMSEYIDRYDEFACFMAEHGYVVTGHDYLGHGLSVKSKEELGFFADYLGNSKLISDIFKLKCLTGKEYSHVPYYIMGHSFGSLLTREFLTTYKDGIDGAVIMGTMNNSMIEAKIAKFLCYVTAMFHKSGMRYRSAFINNLSIGHFDSFFKEEDVRNAWVTSDEEERKKYNGDALCNFIFTVGAYKDLMDGLIEVNKKSNLESMRKDLPILMVSGEHDPVGNMGKGVKKLYKTYKKLGLNVRLKLYRGARHELLHERKKDKVFQEILCFIESTQNT